jgi:hypothetical protein
MKPKPRFNFAGTAVSLPIKKTPVKLPVQPAQTKIAALF